jgi:hypothetical protein
MEKSLMAFSTNWDSYLLLTITLIGVFFVGGLFFSPKESANKFVTRLGKHVRALAFISLAAIIVLLIMLLIGSYIDTFRNQPISKDPAQWGQMGDFFGGMLNPILAFASFIALLYTIRIQSEELRLTREEFQKSVAAQNGMALAQAESVKVHLEAAEQNRSIAEFNYLTATFHGHSQAASSLLYKSLSDKVDIDGAITLAPRNSGLWYLYLEAVEKVKNTSTEFTDFDGLSSEFASLIESQHEEKYVIDLREIAFLIGETINRLQKNPYFSEMANSFINESQRVFSLLHLIERLTNYGGYEFDPSPFLEMNRISRS